MRISSFALSSGFRLVKLVIAAPVRNNEVETLSVVDIGRNETCRWIDQCKFTCIGRITTAGNAHCPKKTLASTKEEEKAQKPFKKQ